MSTAAMRALPVGFPKVMITTMASGDVSAYLETSDIVMMPSVVDVSGLNSILRGVMERGAGAICGMVEAFSQKQDEKPTIVASMFGNTTSCVEHARSHLEESGFEVLVFHATGAGGRTMETLIESGLAQEYWTSPPLSGQTSWWAAFSVQDPIVMKPLEKPPFPQWSSPDVSTW